MLTRLSVSNFRCLDNFSLELPSEALLLGYNGAGKSTVLEVLRRLQDFILGKRLIAKVATPSDLTAWTTLDTVDFRLGVRLGEQEFAYTLVANIGRKSQSASDGSQPAVLEESLAVDGKLIVSQKDGEVSLYGSKIGMPWGSGQSLMAVFNESGDSPFARFKDSITNWVIVRPNAPFMEGDSAETVAVPSKYATNLVAWYQYLARDQRWNLELKQLLTEVWDDFDYLRLQSINKQSNSLVLYFKNDRKEEVSLGFDQMSDGERMLLFLYMTVAHLRVTDGASVFIDEPDNYIALSEVQPWLLHALESLERNDQLVLASHHPQIVEMMGEDRSLYLGRPSHTAGTRVSRIESGGIPISEKLARGWINSA